MGKKNAIPPYILQSCTEYTEVVALVCRLTDVKRKEVISTRDGSRLGCVGDVELDTENAQLSAIIVYGRLRFFGLLGREDDFVIRWSDIEVIGDDTILVRYCSPRRYRRKNLLSLFFTE